MLKSHVAVVAPILEVQMENLFTRKVLEAVVWLVSSKKKGICVWLVPCCVPSVQLGA